MYVCIQAFFHIVHVDMISVCQNFFRTVVELLKLEKIEFSGVRGQSLSDKVLAMFNDFNDLMTAMVGKPYDCLDPESEVRMLHVRMRMIIHMYVCV